jgi:DNA-binding transcriptional MerR regulator
MVEAIPEKLYFKIGEVADIAGVKPYVLRYWESEFNLLRPSKTQTNQRLYRRKEVELILEIRRLLYDEKFTIAGAKRVLADRIKPKPEQLPLGFPDPGLRDALRKVRGELVELKKRLTG